MFSRGEFLPQMRNPDGKGCEECAASLYRWTFSGLLPPVATVMAKNGRDGRTRWALRFAARFGFAVLTTALFVCPQVLSAQSELPRFEVAPVFAEYHAPALSRAVTDQLELGGRFTWNWLPHLSLEAEYASTLRKPAAETQKDGGYFSQALFGVKSGVRWKKFGLFAKFRPGLISYSMVITSVSSNGLTFGRLTDAAFDVGGGAEFFFSRRWLFRYDASDLVAVQGPISLPVDGQNVTFAPFTTHSLEAEVSAAFRF